MAQEMFMSPKEILSYLCDLEEKLPKREYKIYKESHKHNDYNFSHVTPGEMNEECQKMLAFAGMGSYKADARFAKLDDSLAGCTTPGDTADGFVHIEVNINMQDNWKAILATLAHEICHQVIHLHGIRPMINNMTEVYTELCTIYLGFGQLILDGYNTNVRGVKHNLGYLNPNNYKVTNHLVAVVCGGISSQSTSLFGNDVMVDDAVRIWESEDDRKEFNKKTLERRSEVFSETMRYISNMESLLDIYRQQLKQQADKLDKDFISFNDAFRTGQSRSLRIFNTLYTAYCEGQNNEKDGTNKVLEAALYNLYNDVKQRVGVVELRPDVVCPSCGKRYPYREINKGKMTVKCGKCGTHFVADTTDWSPSQVQRQVEQRRIAKQKKQQEELDAYRYQITAEEKAAAWRESECLKQELTTIREGIDKLPRIFRWALKNYIHRQADKVIKTHKTKEK